MLAPATQTRARQAFDSYLSQLPADPEEAAQLAFTRPILLRPDVLDFLQAADNVQPGQAAMQVLRYVQARIEQEPRVYRIGVGPVEALWQQLETADLSLAQAVIAAKGLPITETLTPVYVERLLTDLMPAAARPQTWRQSRIRGQLVQISVQACDRRDDPDFRLRYIRGAVRWAHGLLISVPDGALLTEAAELGQERLSAVRAGGDAEAINDAEFELAALWTDPYCSGRTGGNYEHDEQAWRLRAASELNRVDGRDPQDYEMPPTTEALATAMEHWRAARAANPDNAPTLAGLAEAAMWEARFAAQPVAADAEPAVRHGLKLVGDDPGQQPMKSRLLMLASAVGISVEPKSELVKAEPDALVRQFGNLAGDMVLDEIVSLVGSAPELALAVLDRQRELLLDPDQLNDSSFRLLCETYGRAFHNAIGAPGDIVPPADKDFAEHAAEVLSRLGPDPQPERLAASLIWLALLSTTVNAEETGLTLVAEVRQQAPLFARRNEWLLRTAEAGLLNGQGVNAYNRNDLPAALHAYLHSLRAWLGQARLEPVIDALARLADIATGADTNATLEIIAGMISVAPAIAAKVGGDADDYIARVFAGVLGALVAADSINSEILWTILQFVKGLRTAMLLDRAKPVPMRTDPEAAGILDRIAQRGAGTTEPVTLYRAFEKRRQQLLLGNLVVPSLLGLDQARRALDRRTVVVSTTTFIDRDRRSSRAAGIFWDEDQTFVATRPMAADTPRDEIPWLPNSAHDVLARLASQGRDHLCIIPDQGLHDAPWHLYGWDGKVLADDWIVTLLPHPHLLFSGRGGLTVVGQQSLPVLAVGVTHSPAAPELPPLTDAAGEAHTIASRLGGRALVDADATEQAIMQIAASARYLHIASHGRFEAEAPSFHALLLQPDDSSDGVLCAWEVAELDLRAVRLVTLSACETAKLVVQSGENVDGLPFAFLTAGVRAVIGTQWDIETKTSRYFFEQLYAGLQTADDLRDAFRSAQTSTRQQFPDPQRWAAFYLLGDWR
jgi:CHAT domain